MPSFDVVSEVDFQEVRNAVDQADREVSTRFDFKGTGSTVELNEKTIELATESDQRLKALTQVLEEKLVKRKVSLKLLSYGEVEEASKGTVRQSVTLNVGISDEKAREIGKYIKGLTLKGVQHQVQGDQLRVSGKKRDDLQNGHRGAQGEGLRDPAAVHQLPGLTSLPKVSGGRSPDRVRGPAQLRAPGVGVGWTGARRRAMRSAVGGWVLNRLAKLTLRPLSGLMM